MRVKGKRVINNEDAAEFANTLRGQFIISQALCLAIKHLEKYEDKKSILYSIEQAEPSNRQDMMVLLDAFPLYRVMEQELWERQEDNE
jgi:hypothetical protein